MKTITLKDAPNGVGIRGQRPTWISTNVSQSAVSALINANPKLLNEPAAMIFTVDLSDIWPEDMPEGAYCDQCTEGIVFGAEIYSENSLPDKFVAAFILHEIQTSIQIGYGYFDEAQEEDVFVPLIEVTTEAAGLTKTSANFDGTKYDLATLIEPINYSGNELKRYRWYRIPDSQDSSKEYVFSCQAPGLKINSMTKDQYGFRVEFDVASNYSSVWYGKKGATAFEDNIVAERSGGGTTNAGAMQVINGRLCIGYLYIVDDGQLYSWADALTVATTDKVGSKWAADGVTIRLAPAFSHYFSKNNDTVSWYNGLEIMTRGYVQEQGFGYEYPIGSDFSASIASQAFYQGGIKFAYGATDSESIEYFGGLLFGADKREDLDLGNNSFDITGTDDEEWGYVDAGALPAGTYTITASTTDPETSFTRGSLKVITLTWNQGVPVIVDFQEAQSIFSDTPGVVTFTSTGSEAVFIIVDCHTSLGIHVELDAAQ